jgi:hypothetical protein
LNVITYSSLLSVLAKGNDCSDLIWYDLLWSALCIIIVFFSHISYKLSKYFLHTLLILIFPPAIFFYAVWSPLNSMCSLYLSLSLSLLLSLLITSLGCLLVICYYLWFFLSCSCCGVALYDMIWFGVVSHHIVLYSVWLCSAVHICI